MDYTLMKKAPRLLMEAALKPAMGDRFQPTGFADIGAAEYTRPDEDGKSGTKMLLVESAQSVANRLEKTCLDGDGPEIDPELKGLPYVVTTLEGKDVEEIRASSLVEAHRLASPYFLRTEFKDKLAGEMGYTGKGPLNWKKIYATLFKYDPNTLVHGVFLSLLGDGRVRVPRAVTGFIEAEDVKQVVSGGVKNSPVDPTGEIRVQGDEGEKGVYSNVPYSRVEYVGKIRAYFNVDLSLIRGYGLGEDAERLLMALSLLKIRRFVDSHLRLRTACDLLLDGEVEVKAPKGFVLPSEDELLQEVKAQIGKCKSQFANPAVTELKTTVVRTSKKGAASAEQGGSEA